MAAGTPAQCAPDFLRISPFPTSPVFNMAATAALDPEHRHDPNRDVVPLA
jgi:hypothetical protein